MSILKLKDSQGNWISVPTLKGDKGNGIQSAILNDDYTLTLTFTDGTTYKTPSIRGEKGEKGEPATDMEIHICSASEYDAETRIPTIANPNDKTFYLVPTEDGTSPDLFTEWVYVNGAWEMFGSASVDLSGYLTDVTVGGTSIVDNGVANIPIATANNLGVVKVNTTYGIGSLSDGTLGVVGASVSSVKQGTTYSSVITPARQDTAAFYGLAKAAGYDEKDSTLPVGQYTDEAKSFIQDMLGITDKYSSKEWVAESETELVTNAHSVGDLFYIGETLYKVIADLNAGDAINVGVNVEEVNVNDILDDYATKEDVQDNISIVEKSTSGSIASFDDGMDDVPLKELVVDINPVQDLHGYDSPWVGGGGKNLFDESKAIANATYTYTDGEWSISAPYGQGGRVIQYTNGISVSNGQTITISADVKISQGSESTNKQICVGAKDSASNGSYPKTDITLSDFDTWERVSAQVTTTSDYVWVGIQPRNSDTNNVVTFKNVQLEEGSTATDHVPYENICPISGFTGSNVKRTGKNLLNPEKFAKCTTDGNGVFTFFQVGYAANLFTGQNGTSHVIDDLSKCLVLPAGTYTYSVLTVSGSPIIDIYSVDDDGVKTFIVRASGTDNYFTATFTLTEQTRICLIRPNNTSPTVFKEPQIEVGSNATEYVPYQGTTLPISWQTEAGTVYGGKLDVLSGVLTINSGSFKVSDYTWTRYSTEGAYKFYCTPTGIKRGANVKHNGSICSEYVGVPFNNLMTTPYAFSDVANGTGRISVHDPNFYNSTAQEFMTAKADVRFVYPLATPITVQLSPTEVKSLYGQNNIFADTGDTEVEYFSQVDEDLIDYIKANLNSYAKKDLLNDYVDDIQIDGTSIVENGIAEIPFATPNAGGIVKIDSSLGIKLNDTNKLLINRATTTQAKAGSDAARPIVPICQHESVFYGLTKAAGVDMASSSNAVGNYTDEAKTAIKQMLGVHDTYDSFVEEVTGTDVTITGQPSYRYNCGEVLSLTVTPPESGTIDFRFTSGSSPTVLTLPSTVKMPEWWVEVEANTIYEMCITDGIYCGVMTWAM